MTSKAVKKMLKWVVKLILNTFLKVWSAGNVWFNPLVLNIIRISLRIDP
jgi:hypothetical protein